MNDGVPWGLGYEIFIGLKGLVLSYLIFQHTATLGPKRGNRDYMNAIGAGIGGGGASKNLPFGHIFTFIRPLSCFPFGQILHLHSVRFRLYIRLYTQ